ncbi:MAG: hypothetical protein ABJF11_11985 [Reichenbachiella sp.]|uniref:leucine-rich repeat domain-containing protein n=1 Tax=Reichenbachiella sp. TaxID=2184521 RepID=UPI003264B78C
MKYYLTLILLTCFYVGEAQTEIDSAQFDEVRSMVKFYEYFLNTLGASTTPYRDKQIIISDSYTKIFKDDQVQIEDDLLANRRVTTNKDVTAYLRDVDFFYENIRFSFQDIQIEQLDHPNGNTYFLASFESILQGTTVANEDYSSAGRRFIEVNLDQDKNDLKIVSVYSTKISREEELRLWWDGLSISWKEIFTQHAVSDSVSTEILLQIGEIDTLIIAGNSFIFNLEPLSVLKELTHLDISNTRIDDLSPLRNIRALKQLTASNTRIKQISPIQFQKQLTHLDLSNSALVDLQGIEEMTAIAYLNLSGTSIIDFEPIRALKHIKNINLSGTTLNDPTILATSMALDTVDLSRTAIDHLFVFRSLPNVRFLNLAETKIVNLNGLDSHPNLTELNINHTAVEKLDPLTNSPQLRTINADASKVSEEVASGFMADNSRVVVITNSAELLEWWKTLPKNWKTALEAYLTSHVTIEEELVVLLNLDSLNLANKNLYTSAPLQRFKRLRSLDISHNDFTQLDFTAEMSNLEILKGQGLPIHNTKGLGKNFKLKHVDLSDSKLREILTLSSLPRLEVLVIDQTLVEEPQIVKVLSSNPELVIIYQTETLNNWWKELNETWKKGLGFSSPSSYDLHQMIERDSISISNQNISTLAPLRIFIRLEKISLDRIKVLNLKELYTNQNLKSLTYTNSPLQDLEGISQLVNLEFLNISNTAIEDLKDLYHVRSLKHLNCAGTGIKNLRGLDELTGLRSLNVSNTRIWRLERLYQMKDLKTFVCNNTRLSQAKVDQFQAIVPECTITFY